MNEEHGTIKKSKVPPAAILGAAVFALGLTMFLLPRKEVLPEVKSVEVKRGELRRTVTGTGQAQSENTRPVHFKMGGTVEEVMVKVGDLVLPNQVLATLDGSATRRAIQNAAVSVNTAEVELQRARNEVARTQADAERARSEVSKASAAVENARGDLRRAEAEAARGQGDVTKAELDVQRAREEVNRVIAAGADAARERKRNINNATLALEGARAALQSATARLDLQQSLYNVGTAAAAEVDAARRERDDAQRNVTQAQNNLSAAQASGSNSAQVAEAQARTNLLTAETNLRQIRSAVANTPVVVQAKAALNNALAGVSAAQSGVKQANIAVQQAQVGVRSAENNLRNARNHMQYAQEDAGKYQLVAPTGGVVAAVNVRAGDPAVGDKPAVALADPNNLYLDIPFNETRATDLKIGQEATIEFDALPNNKYSGQVARIDPVAQSAGQTSRVNARIALSGNDNKDVKLGYTALVTVTTHTEPSALLLPQEAVEDGKVWLLRAAGDDVFTASKLSLVVGERDANNVSVTGVKENDLVISPFPTADSIAEGARVRLKKEGDEKASKEGAKP